jgi:hypothetical protein
LIDRKVIDGHVIPHHVIFTAPAHLEHPYETIAFEDNLKVTATIFTQNDGKTNRSELLRNFINFLAIKFTFRLVTKFSVR